MSTYAIPVYLPRRRRIVTPGEWLREKLEAQRREREATIAMAIGLQNAPVTGFINHSTGTLTVSVTVNAGSNQILVVCTQQEINTVTVGGITFGGVALTKLDAQAGASFSRAEMWYLKAPAASTANVVVTYSPNNASGKVVGCYVLSGVAQTTPWRTAVKGTGSATSSSLTVASVVSGDYLIDSLCVDGTGHSTAPGANQTERWDIESGAGETTGVSDTQDGVDGGVMSHTWTTSAPFSHVADALIPAAVAGGKNPTIISSRSTYF